MKGSRGGLLARLFVFFSSLKAHHLPLHGLHAFMVRSPRPSRHLPFASFHVFAVLSPKAPIPFRFWSLRFRFLALGEPPPPFMAFIPFMVKSPRRSRHLRHSPFAIRYASLSPEPQLLHVPFQAGAVLLIPASPAIAEDAAAKAFLQAVKSVVARDHEQEVLG
jgi:hypothetical protein